MNRVTDRTPIPERTLRRVRALLDKAEATEFEDEADALNAQAQRLISQYGIEAAMLDAGRAPGDRSGVERRPIVIGAPYARDRIGLLGVIGLAMGCRVITLSDPAAPPRTVPGRVELWGFPSDTARVELVYTSLLAQAVRRVERVRPERSGEHLGAYRRAWWQGFIVAISERIAAQEEQAASAAQDAATARHHECGGVPTSVALVLAERGDTVQAAVITVYPDVEPESPRRLSSRAGLRAGYQAGNEADMGNRDYVGTGTRGRIGNG